MLHASDYMHDLLNHELGYTYKLEIVEHAKEHEEYHRYTEEEKDKLIDFVYHYWLENHTDIYGTITLFDIVEWTFTEFAEEFKTMDFKEFCDRIDGVYEEIGDNY